MDRPTFVVAMALASGIAGFLVVNLVLDGLRQSPDDWETLAARLYGTFHIGADGSVAESFNHGMAFAAAVMFLAAGTVARSRTCIVMAVIMMIAWFDDSAQYHERVGRLLPQHFPGLRNFGPGASTLAEMLAFLSIGIVCLGLAVWARQRFGPRDRFAFQLARWPILLLVACASLVDFVHSALLETRFEQLFLYLEDGGEMLAMALIATASLYLARNIERIDDRP
ncbi:hypothetical protein [Paracoccus sp. AK26]|uniref:hypothetical protein n=1 Tax=Paracoccus sp. AK26 TaxID=2589076 RepID=UPI0014305F19|nr:hypothetical protein [Paracoccus sp. AK26]